MRLFELPVKFTDTPSLRAPKWVKSTIDLDKIISVTEHPEDGVYESCYIHMGDLVSYEFKITYEEIIKKWSSL